MVVTVTLNKVCKVIIIIFQLHTATFKTYCAILVRRFNFLPSGVSTRVTTQEHLAAEGRTVGEKCPVILPKCHVTFRDLFHTVKLRHPWMWVPVTTAWRVLRLRMEERLLCGRYLWINWISSRGQPTRCGPLAWGLREVLTTPLLKKYMLRITHERCFLWRQNNPEVNYSPIRIFGGGSVSRGSITQP
jgi:hypothetical protein